MAWRVAKSLDQLLRQANALAPFRSKQSDGSIGNAEHASRSSDHNPHVKDGSMGVVTARDYTHDPAHGFDAHKFADTLRTNRDVRLKYVISAGRIWTPAISPVWRPYYGANAHQQHTHVSVRPLKALYDDETPWKLAMLPVLQVQPISVVGWTPAPGRAKAAVAYMQKLGWSKLAAAAIIGQGIWESGGNRIGDIITTALGDGKTAHGGWQWRNERYVGKHGLLMFAANRGRSSADLEIQLQFVDHELKTTERRSGELLKVATTPEEATDAMIGYLRPAGFKWEKPRGGHAWNSRLVLTNTLLNS